MKNRWVLLVLGILALFFGLKILGGFFKLVSVIFALPMLLGKLLIPIVILGVIAYAAYRLTDSGRSLPGRRKILP